MPQFEILSGACVPVCTPFDPSGESIDETKFLDHIDVMIDAGVDIILVCGGTGEFAYLRPEEKRRMIEIAGKHVGNRAKYLVQTSAINTVDTIDNTKHAEDHGADAVMVLPPYFEGPDMEGVYYHYEHLLKIPKRLSWYTTFPQHRVSISTPIFSPGCWKLTMFGISRTAPAI